MLSTPITWLPDSPAFLELHPNDVRWYSVGDFHRFLSIIDVSHATDLSDEFTNLFQDVEQVFKLDTHHSAPFGFYRFQTSSSHSDYFIKIVQPQQAKRQRVADQVSSWLRQEGINTPVMHADKSVSISDQIEWLSYDHVKGGFCLPTMENMALLGSEIAQLHNVLQHYPKAVEVQQLGLQRHDMLKAQFQQFKTDLSLQQQLPHEVTELMLNYEISDFDVLIENAQMVHGDLNQGNVWFVSHSQATDDVYFLDFEDSLTAWFNPLAELAFVFERFILIDENVECHELGVTLFTEYLKQRSSESVTAFKQPRDLSKNLQALAMRALLLLLQISQKKQLPLSDEWKKFVFLFNLSTQKQNEIENILCKANQQASI